jgi:desulfoferrodoxin (superoxide reductase-like protein)
MKYFMLALLVTAMPLVAHPPKGVDLDFDSETGVLSVEMTHSVNDASKHYVKKVTVELNGKKIIEQTFRSQLDEERQQVLYKIIDAKEGDKISVTAYCNISGKKKGELEVTSQESDE